MNSPMRKGRVWPTPPMTVMRPQIDQGTQGSRGGEAQSSDSASAKPIGEAIETPPAALVTST